MKKWGKHEKILGGTKTEQSPAKNPLLQTYFTSLLSLVLCVVMFLGTSYAWFTSEVQNSGNEIYVGTLKVGLYKDHLVSTTDAEGNTTSTTQRVDLANNAEEKLFSGNIRWEPGYTALETIHVVNKGDLAFKYVLNFTDGAAIRSADSSPVILDEIAKHFDVWVYDHRANGRAPNPNTYTALTNEDSGWVSAGSLDKLLAGEAVLDGVMYTVRAAGTQAPNAGTTDGIATEDTFTIALHMREDAPADVMGQKITLSAKLIAYQMGSEEDSFNNNTYDQMAATEAQLREALANGGTVALAADIKLTEGLTVAAGKTVILDLNGHTISQTTQSATGQVMLGNNGNLTITGSGKLLLTDNGEVSAEAAYGSYTIRNNGTLVVESGTIELVRGDVDNASQAIFNYSGTTTIDGGKIIASKSRSVRLWNGSVTINGGEFDGQVWAQSVAHNSPSLTINGGSFKPASNDASSVYVTNGTYDVQFSVTGGSFTTKIGVESPEKLANCITGGEFSDDARNNTASQLFAATE